MKASKLRDELAALIAKHGDREVYLPSEFNESFGRTPKVRRVRNLDEDSEAYATYDRGGEVAARVSKGFHLE